jgi:hypothetical protein
MFDWWTYLKENDAPNWFAIGFSLVVWPSVLSLFVFFWRNRKRQNVPRFLVTFAPIQISIGAASGNAVALSFINQTGSVAYLHRAQLTEVQKRFPVPKEASRDMASGGRELTFALVANPQVFTHYECILQTNERATAAIAIQQPMDDAFYSYRPSWLRRLLTCPKYFLLEYVVVVGRTQYSVATVY